MSTSGQPATRHGARFKFSAGGVSRKVAARLCVTCGAPVLAGLDGERLSAPVRVDPTPLNALGEATALMYGRLTYNLRRIAGEYVLDHRYAEIISGRPAGADNAAYEVMASHECGVTYSAECHALPKRTETITQYDTPDEPPF